MQKFTVVRMASEEVRRQQLQPGGLTRATLRQYLQTNSQYTTTPVHRILLRSHIIKETTKVKLVRDNTTLRFKYISDVPATLDIYVGVPKSAVLRMNDELERVASKKPKKGIFAERGGNANKRTSGGDAENVVLKPGDYINKLDPIKLPPAASQTVEIALQKEWLTKVVQYPQRYMLLLHLVPDNTNRFDITNLGALGKDLKEGIDASEFTLAQSGTIPPSAGSAAMDAAISTSKCERQVVRTPQGLFDVQEMFGLDDNMDCTICFTNPKDVVLLPCRHVNMCHECHSNSNNPVTTCPVCRVEIKSFMRFTATQTAGKGLTRM